MPKRYRWDNFDIFPRSPSTATAATRQPAKGATIREDEVLRFLAFRQNGRKGLAASQDGALFRGLVEGDAGYPGSLDGLIKRSAPEREAAAQKLLSGQPVDLSMVEVLQPLEFPAKIICVGLNYRDHARETGSQVPDYPTLLARFVSSLIPP